MFPLFLCSSDRLSAPLPSPAEQAERAEAGGEERESGGKWSCRRTCNDDGVSDRVGPVKRTPAVILRRVGEGPLNEKYVISTTLILHSSTWLNTPHRQPLAAYQTQRTRRPIILRRSQI